VLVGLLWCVAVLSLVVVGVLRTANLELRLTKNHADLIQAHYLALAGIEKAKALLYHESHQRRGSHVHHSGQLYDAPEHFRDVPLGRGQFRVLRQGRPDEFQTIVYGVLDEESRLNVNHASEAELANLPAITPEVVARILDYRDPDHEVRPGGAEAEQYAAHDPPYLPRNGPFRTTRELLMVLGMPRDLFLGADLNQNGLLDPEERSGLPPHHHPGTSGFPEAGWSGMITVHSGVRNVNAAGEARVNLQAADEDTLAAVPGIAPELARAIIRHRDQSRLETLVDLLEVTAPGPDRPSPTPTPEGPESSVPTPTVPATPFAGGPTGSGPVAVRSVTPGTGSPTAPQRGAPTQAPTGERLVSIDLLVDLGDDLTTEAEMDHPGAININTAGVDVLACLPGVSRELAQAMVSHRQSNGFYPHAAALLRVQGMDPEIFREIAPRVTARSETFRILSEGEVGSTGARKRIQVTVRIGAYDVATLAWREDDL
jgi:DNA uptake protein ComE-like DNA-binding protein